MKTNIYRIFLSFFVLTLLGGHVYGQTFNPYAWSGAYMNVDSYNGTTIPNPYTLQIGYQGIDIRNWALLVKINKPITNNQGKIIPAEKIRIKINTIAADPASVPPTLGQLGVSNNPIPLSLVNQAIIPNSNWSLSSSEHVHKLVSFSFDIIVEGGGYLQGLKPNDPHSSPYYLDLDFAIYEVSRNRKLYESGPISSRIVINPSGTPPVEPVYSIQVNSNAVNGNLEFKSISDYVNGVSQTYTNGLSVVSNTPYALQVKAQSSAFASLNNSIPLNTVSLNLKAANNNSVAGTVQLSNAEQTIIGSVINSGTQPRAFDIRYFTSPNDTRLQNAKPDTYKTTLIYTLTPQ